MRKRKTLAVLWMPTLLKVKAGNTLAMKKRTYFDISQQKIVIGVN